MVVAGLWSKGQSLSACYLLSSTVVLMLVIFALEDALFPQKCSSCVSSSDIGVLTSIGRTRLPVRSPSKKEHVHASLDESLKDSENGSKFKVEISPELLGNPDSLVSKSKHSHPADSEISEVKPNVEESSEIRISVEQKVDDSTDPGKLGANAQLEVKDETKKNDSRQEPEKLGNETRNGDPQSTALVQAELEQSNDKEVTVVLQPPIPPKMSWVAYYTNIYKHPEAKLRLLTADDGAPRLRSKLPPPEREITIVTQTSADRLPAVEATCTTWGGAMAVAVHVRLKSEIPSVYALLEELHTRMEEESRCRLDLQAVTEDGFATDEDAHRALYPVNALRNVALGMATTKLLFLLDADFKPIPRLHEFLTEDEESYKNLLREATEEKQLFVVPAFEAASSRGRQMEVPVPESMEDLRNGWEGRKINCFHCVKSRTGHLPTMFHIFFNQSTASRYRIPYRDGYEPYVIGAADVIPWYDARFRGYGQNKISQIYASAAAGMGFQVLRDVFVYELPHPPSDAHESYVGRHKDPDQRYRIVGLYRQFKEEVARKQMKLDPARFTKFLHDLQQTS